LGLWSLILYLELCALPFRLHAFKKNKSTKNQAQKPKTKDPTPITHHCLNMANEDLIYRLTKAVYSRLGSATDEQTVEQLVTEIYREVEPLLNTNGTSYSSFSSSPSSGVASQTQEGSSDRMIISVFGVDHPGIVAGVSQILAEASCSIVDINQTVVQGKFAMVIIANTTRARESATELIARLRREGEKLGVRIYAQREDLFNAMHRV